MRHIRVATVLPAPPHEVWERLRDIASHVDWMADADAIRFTTERREGVGTAFECDTKVGPLRMTDKMQVTAWVPDREMAIRHTGVVAGRGRFLLEPFGARHTTFTWDEELAFPRWMRPAAPVARRVLAWVWRRNLRRLRALF
ncbi:MAG TPA: SRPBCC family protein [Acidimicrobiales bacterium]|nr:SRPBCC family protein [Acidimicrobiales bacterium]